MFPNLETERITLRELTVKDAEFIYQYFSMNEVTQYYGLESFENHTQAMELIHIFKTAFEEKKGIRWGIEIKETKALVGTIGFNSYAPKNRRAEIGYDLHPNHWKKGFASEAITKILSYGFNDMGLTRIGAIVFVENNASISLLEKMGFEKEGTLRNYMYQNGVVHDTYIYSIINTPEKG